MSARGKSNVGLSSILARSKESPSEPTEDEDLEFSCDNFPIDSKPASRHHFEYRVVIYTKYVWIENGSERAEWKPRTPHSPGIPISSEELKRRSIKKPLDHSDIFAEGVIKTMGKDLTLGDAGPGWKWAGSVHKRAFLTDRYNSKRTIFRRCRDCLIRKQQKDVLPNGQPRFDENGFETIPLDNDGEEQRHMTSAAPGAALPSQQSQARPDEPSEIGEHFTVVSYSRGGNVLMSTGPPPPPYPPQTKP
ncbi:MAG: hypothetical protein Q9160_000369 [Pyrenula sp. 1 TL-2023]